MILLSISAVASLLPCASPQGDGRGFLESWAEIRPERIESRRASERYSEAIHATDDALKWLIANQGKNGAWDPAAFREAGSSGREAVTPAGVTGLTLVLFASRGYTTAKGPYQEPLRRAVGWLREYQSNAGAYCITSNTDHALATWGMVELAAVERSDPIHRSVDRAIRFLVQQQNEDGGFHFMSKGGSSTVPATFFAAMPLLLAARLKGLKPEVRKSSREAKGRVARWLEGVITNKATLREHVKVRQSFPATAEAQTDAALWLRFFLTPIKNEIGPDGRRVVDPINVILQERYKNAPARDRDGRTIDPLQLFFAAHTAAQFRPRVWTKYWVPHLAAVAATRRRGDRFAGSWDPVGTAKRTRMLTTVLTALALQGDTMYGPGFLYQDPVTPSGETGTSKPRLRRGAPRRRRRE